MNNDNYTETELTILQRALKALEKVAGVNGGIVQYNTGTNVAADAQIQIEHEGMKFHYQVMLKRKVDRAITLADIVSKVGLNAGQINNLLLVTTRMTANLGDRCREMGLQYLDAAGNTYLKQGQLLILIKGLHLDEADAWLEDDERVGVTATALRYHFAILCKRELLNAPYRIAQQETGVALSKIGKMLTELRKRGYVIDGAKGRILTEKERLMQDWTANYQAILRRKLNLRRFKAPTDEPDWWKRVAPGHYGAQWGGEVAAAKMEGYLRPVRFTLYFGKGQRQMGLPHLVTELQLRPDPTGEIEVLDAFWNFDGFHNHETVPPLLVYADLMATLDPRNMEAAKTIYDKYLAKTE